ncbi:hypothetical protein IVB40_07515 [Bradyrhizobium sp. 40]|uniref:hypothetical protein n=1 Tax=Bradyrhizobium sp. 40 TaxID=2782674 RepID=UPI001FFF5663|nr:hypothetical protein [Bradyrhizobium sp. 40]UPJ43908.1 hypothetical protein IVB40_07515 [Bradyrhizobium sp. 40]
MIPQRTASVGGHVTRAQLKKYPDVVTMWQRRFDTAAIAAELKLPESLVHAWIVNFRELGRVAA